MAAGSLLPPVVAVLTANISEFSAKMKTAAGEMEGVEGTAGKMGVLGKTALVGLATGAVAVGVESVKMASSFQSTMELIATQAHAGQGEVDRMRQSVLDLAPTVGIGPEKLAEGLYHVESTGLRGQAAMDVLKASAQEAALGMADFDSVTYAMSGVMSIAMKDVGSAADGVAYLNTIVGTGDMHMQDLANAIGTGVLPAFKNAGLGMADFGASLTVLTDNSMPAQVAANHLRTAVAMIANQSPAAAKALGTIGIKQNELAQDLAKPNGLLVAMEDLKSHLEKSGKTATEQGQIISKAFGGAKSASTVETLLEELDKLKGKYTEMGGVAQRAKQQQDDWANTQNTFKQKMNEVGAQFQVWAIEIGSKLLPILSKLADWFMSSVKWLGAHKDMLLTIASGAIPFLIAGMGKLVESVAKSIKAIGTAMKANPWMLLLSVVIMVVEYIITHWDQIKKYWSAFVDWLKGLWSGIVDFFVNLWNHVKNAFSDAWNWIVSFVKGWYPVILGVLSGGMLLIPALIFKYWDKIRDFFVGLWNDVKNFFVSIWNSITGWLKSKYEEQIEIYKKVWTELKDFFTDLWNKVKNFFVDIWNNIVNWLKEKFTREIEIYKRAWGELTGFFSNLWTNIKDGVHNAWNAVIDFIKGIPGDVKDFFSDAGEWLLHAGEAILHGLWQGLQNAWHSVTSFIGGIGNWIADHKGPIDYDRQLLVPHGNAIMDGLHEGLRSGGKRVQNYLDGFTTGIGQTAINGALSVSAGGAVDGSSRSGDVIINIDSRGFQQLIQTSTLKFNLRNNGNGLALRTS